jgi:hypothetical protein
MDDDIMWEFKRYYNAKRKVRRFILDQT